MIGHDESFGGIATLRRPPSGKELFVILTNYEDLFAKVHDVTFLTYLKTETKWIFIIYGKFYPKLIYNLYIFKFT